MSRSFSVPDDHNDDDDNDEVVIRRTAAQTLVPTMYVISTGKNAVKESSFIVRQTRENAVLLQTFIAFMFKQKGLAHVYLLFSQRFK